MAQDTINTQFDFSGFNTLKKDLRDATVLYQQMVASGQATTEQIKQQAARVAELRDQIDDANDSVKAMTGAGQFQAFGRAISAAAGGFAALQGTIALVGGESEDLQKTMVKLQAAISISQGLSQLEDLGNAFSNLKKVAVNAFAAIRTAIGSTGIGLLILAIGAAAVATYNWVTATNEETESLNKLNRSTEDLNYTLENYNSSSELAILRAKARGASEAELYELELKIVKGRIAIMQTQIEAEQKKAELLDRIRDEEINDYADLTEKAVKYGGALGGVIMLYRDLTTSIGESTKKSGEQKKAVDKLIFSFEKEKIALDQLTLNYGINLREKRKKDRDEANEAAEKARKEQEARTKEEYENSLKNLEIYFEERRNKILEDFKNGELTQQEYDLAILNLQKESLQAQIVVRKDYNKEYIDLQNQILEKDIEIAKLKQNEVEKQEEAAKQLAKDQQERTEDEFNKTLTSLEDYFNKEETLILQNAAKTEETEIETQRKLRDLRIKDLEARIIAFKDYGKSTTELEKELAALRLEIAEEEKEKRLKLDQELFEGVMKTASSITTAIGAMQEARMAQELKAAGENAAKREEIEKKYFEKNKQVQIAETIIDTISSAVAAYKALAGIPVVGPGLGAIAATAALVTGYARVAEIRATTFQSSGTSGSTVSTGSKFAGGGLLTGPSHSQGGIKTMFGELEGGEFIVNRIAAQRFMPVLEEINSSGNTPSDRMMMPNATQTPIVKTYVVANDMYSELEKKKKLDELARL